MRNGKCTDPSCKLQHIKDAGILNNEDEEIKEGFTSVKAKKPTSRADQSKKIVKTDEVDSTFEPSEKLRSRAKFAQERYQKA
jgi:hypothetical protein